MTKKLKYYPLGGRASGKDVEARNWLKEAEEQEPEHYYICANCECTAETDYTPPGGHSSSQLCVDCAKEMSDLTDKAMTGDMNALTEFQKILAKVEEGEKRDQTRKSDSQ